MFLYRKTCLQKRKIPAHIIRAGIFYVWEKGGLLTQELDSTAGQELYAQTEGLLVQSESGMVVGQAAVGAVKTGAHEQ